eukprot:CAMPEP_0171090126 /NCGR_PEP_ID=MMETSP0766_2-20121228/29037_1 /TAXON_ID=439317 /ORGANISM="Gambierdiscus australes, Strain CAWD 149" /LENGTH=127 /DNA_ID=CAMNT_0011548085 /DNA_START=59 /DNA_END=442 /DNA_ORIENTATION=-
MPCTCTTGFSAFFSSGLLVSASLASSSAAANAAMRFSDRTSLNSRSALVLRAAMSMSVLRSVSPISFQGLRPGPLFLVMPFVGHLDSDSAQLMLPSGFSTGNRTMGPLTPSTVISSTEPSGNVTFST